jgi:catechol 2,3-dioxygenase-like lactoylglutathione lyase family enzyme
MSATTTATMNVLVISVPVSDQGRARDFYVEKLGFELVQELDRDGLHWVEVRPPGSSTTFTLVTWFPTMPDGSLRGLVLGTKDIHAAYEALSSRGVRFDGEPEEAFWGTYVTFSDPDGNSFVLSQPPAD